MASLVEGQPSPPSAIDPDDTNEKADSSKKRRLSSDASEHEDIHGPQKRVRAGSSSKRDVPASKAPPSPSSTTASTTNRLGNPKPTGRSDSIQEEKKRGRRLFGGLLSTLSQSTPSTHQKRRQDIERRQQERAHQRQSEDDKLREKKLTKLRKVRVVEQVSFDEQVMKTRHSDVLAKARSLRTRSEPGVYYLPWRPTEMQKEQIDRQIRDAKDLVHREEEEFGRRRRERLGELGVEVKENPKSSMNTGEADQSSHETPYDQTNYESLRREDSDTAQHGHANSGISQPKLSAGKGDDAVAPTNHEPPPPALVAKEEANDDNGDADVMVEDDEDAVIY